MDLPKVAVMEWGEPTIKNVIGVNYETRQLQLQDPGYYGSCWRSFDDLLRQIDIDWHFIQKAASEIDRLQIKQMTLENSERRQF
jgi:hypothetical protein